MPFHDGLEHLHAVHARHPHVRHDHIELSIGEHLQSLLSSVGKLRLPIIAEWTHAALQPLENPRLVIYEKYAETHAAPSILTPSTGNLRMNVVPAFSSVSKAIVPLCLFTITDRAIDKP